MPISMRSVKTLMQRTVPGKKVSGDAARLLLAYLERRAEDLTIHAGRVHEYENAMLSQCGARRKVILSPRHMKMAIDGKFPMAPGNDEGGSEH